MSSITMITHRPWAGQRKSCVWAGFSPGGPRKPRAIALIFAPESNYAIVRTRACSSAGQSIGLLMAPRFGALSHLSLLKTRPSRFSCVFRTDQAIWPVMVRWLGILLGTLRSTVRTHRELALENLALRQQLAVWKARQPRPQLTAMDRIFWVVLSRLWKSWRNSLQMVRPETVVGWHRQGFRRYWAWKSRRRRGRPAIRSSEI